MYSTVDNILLSKFSEFILSPSVYNEFLAIKTEPEPEPEHKIKSIVSQIKPYFPPIGVIDKQHTQKTFIPEQDDTLFWCLFIHKFGKEEYDLIGSKYKNHEIEEKKKIVEYLNENKNALKSMKITKTATQEIMGKLMTNNTTDLQVVHGICAYYKLHIIVVCNSKRSYIEYNYSENDDTDENDILVIFKSHSLLSNSRCKYSIKIGVITKDIINDFVRFVSFDKPFNGISTYKLSNLEIIHEKLGLKIMKKNKIEVFNQINLAVA